jgi:hypothetical protein
MLICVVVEPLYKQRSTSALHISISHCMGESAPSSADLNSCNIAKKELFRSTTLSKYPDLIPIELYVDG